MEILARNELKKNPRRKYFVTTFFNVDVFFIVLYNIQEYYPVDIYMFKVNNRNTRTRCEIYSKLTIKTPQPRWRRSGVYIVNFEHISDLVLKFLLLTLSRSMLTGSEGCV